MSNSKRRQRTYDHRLKELVRSTGIIDIALQRGVPRSTVRGWLTKNMSDVITVDVLDMSLVELQREVVALRRRNARLIALLRLIITVMKVTHFTLSQIRLPQEAQKLRVLQAIEYSRKHFPLKTVLRVIGLSHGRYREWKRVECGLDDLPSCPRLSPHQLTVAEMRTIQEMVTSEKYRHVATGTLARLAERMGEVFASPSTSVPSGPNPQMVNDYVRRSVRLSASASSKSAPDQKQSTAWKSPASTSTPSLAPAC